MSQVRIANKSFGLQSTPTGKRPRGRPRTRWRDYISDLAWSRLCLEPAELFEIATDCEVFRVLLGLLTPRISPNEKRARKWVNEWICNPALKLSIYEIVFNLFAKSECRIQIIISIFGRKLAFCENQLKVSDIEGKMVLTPYRSTTIPL